MVGSLITNKGKEAMLVRAWTPNASLSSTEYLPPTQFSIGIKNTTPTVSATDQTIKVPITDGTVLDAGDNNMTGSNGGDTTTDNTLTFKEGAGVTEDTSQNLLANATSVTKTWTRTLTTFVDATKPYALWFYVKDETTLDKIVSLKVRLGSDASNYYEQTILNADLIQGWNWITTNTDAVNTLTETGTVTGDIDTFILEIETNNATDVFVAGDVVYDLLRQWEESDLYKSFQLGYPLLNTTTREVTIKCFLSSVEANGFLINSVATWNEDTTKLMDSLDVFSGESKSSTDEFTITMKNRMI